MLPSIRLIGLLAAAVPLFVLGSAFPPAAGAAVVYLLVLAVYAPIDAMLLPRRRRIEVRRLVPERISHGAWTPVRLEVRNRSGRSLLVELAERLPEGIEARPPRCAIRLGPRARGEVAYRLRASRRGRHVLAALDVRAQPPLGLFCRQFCLRRPAELHVYPNLLNPRKYALLLRRGVLAEQGLARLRRIGQGTEFESLRYYASGDGLSAVDWKATARRRRLVVKNYQPQRRQSVLVAIDAGRATAGEFGGVSRLDYLVNAAMMLAYVALRQGDWFSVVAFSDRVHSYLPPIRRAESIERVARSLYEVQPNLVESDYAAACAFLGLRHRKRSLICLMTDVIDRDASGVVLAHLRRFARRHLPLAVTLADPELRRLAARPLGATDDPYAKAAAIDLLRARQEALEAMRRHGVSVLDAAPTALTPDLVNRYLLIKATRRL
jgi:uncharacterized protein (DUF58 family)